METEHDRSLLEDKDKINLLLQQNQKAVDDMMSKVLEQNMEMVKGVEEEMRQLKGQNRDLMAKSEQVAKSAGKEMRELQWQNRNLMEQNRLLMENTKVRNGRHLEDGTTGDGFAKRVFASSERYRTTTIGSVSGADEICQSLANTAGLGGIYKAWFSDSSASPSTTFYQSTGPYVLVNGTQIADDWDDLTDGSIDSTIELDEYGSELSEYYKLSYTGTNSDGTAAENNCDEWTSDSSSDMVSVGNPASTGAAWTQANQNCGYKFHLYCFEQYMTGSTLVATSE